MFTFIKVPKIKNRYLFFLAKSFLFLLLVFMVDFSVGYLFKWLYLKQQSGNEYRTKYSIEDTKADILLFGSSRSQQQYNPQYFQQRLNLSCYNVGREGLSILYQYPLLKAVLKRYTPKVILLECDNRMFLYNLSSYDALSCLLPFYNAHPEMRSVIALRSPNEKLKMLSRMYPYNSTFFKIIQGIFKKKDTDINGYVQLEGALQEPIRSVDFTHENYPLDSTKVRLFTSFIDLCKAYKVRLILTSSPYFSREIGRDRSLVIIKQIAVANNIPFFDLSGGHPLLNKAGLFDDTAHVNLIGSRILTNVMIDSILKHGLVQTGVAKL